MGNFQSQILYFGTQLFNELKFAHLLLPLICPHLFQRLKPSEQLCKQSDSRAPAYGEEANELRVMTHVNISLPNLDYLRTAAMKNNGVDRTQEGKGSGPQSKIFVKNRY